MVSMQEDWLKGKVVNKPGYAVLSSPVDFARTYFKHCNEEDVRECCHDVVNLLNGYMNDIGERSNQSHIQVLSNANVFLSVYAPFEQFLYKWELFLNSVTPHLGNKKEISKTFLALFLLKNAADDNPIVVNEIYGILSEKELSEYEMRSAEKKV